MTREGKITFDAPAELVELAQLFKPFATLYAVGGWVRDSLLGISCHDIDICSQLRVEQVKTALSNSDFAISDKSLRLGTVVVSKGDFRAEYTCFRTDSYAEGSGAHSPDAVLFTSSMLADAERRDFACNAVYYDILGGETVDPLGGIEDIKNKVLRRAKHDVFEADGLRILRLVRFAAELGFTPEKETLESAKLNAWRVADIAVERVREELVGCFEADSKHPELKRHGAHLQALRLLDELGLVDMLLPELAALKGLPQPKQYHLYDAYEHSVKAFELSPPELRWAALLHDVGKAPAMQANGNMHGHDVIGEGIVRDIMGRLRFKKSEIRRTAQLVRWHMVDINGNTSEAKLRRFVVQHPDIIAQLCDLIDIDAVASAGVVTRQNRVREAYEYVKAHGLPLYIKELVVDGNDLVALGVPEHLRSAALKDLLEQTAMDENLMDRERALSYLGKWAQKNVKSN